MKIKFINGLPSIVLSGIIINNGVKIYREFKIPSSIVSTIQDLILLIRSKFNRHSINNNFEAGVYLSHLRVTRPEDKILAVGLGSGSTLIPMVKMMEPSGGVLSMY